MNADRDATSHWLTVELLNRYAEVVRAGLNAERLYPQVHRHLALCEACHATLGDLSLALEASAFPIKWSESRCHDWLAFLESPTNVRWAWRPGSHPTSFGLHLSINADWLLTSVAIAPCASPPAHNTGVSLDLQWPPPAEDALHIHLEIVAATATPDRHDLMIRLAASNLPTRAHAHLLAGCEAHHATLQDGRLEFGDVTLEKGIKRIGLVLESL